MNVRFDGVFGPVVSTFRRDSGDLDCPAFVENVKSHVDAGHLGVVVCGSTGEAALLSEMERLELLEAARRAVPPERTLLMGTGGESTRLTVRRCHEAQTVGADAVLVVAPHYYASAMTVAALRAHYTRVADESPLPVLHVQHSEVHALPARARTRGGAGAASEHRRHQGQFGRPRPAEVVPGSRKAIRSRCSPETARNCIRR